MLDFLYKGHAVVDKVVNWYISTTYDAVLPPSSSFYCSSNAYGGGTSFPHLDLTIGLKRGRGLLWPNVSF